jgi:hypothetical protein
MRVTQTQQHLFGSMTKPGAVATAVGIASDRLGSFTAPSIVAVFALVAAAFLVAT